jgi:hypothetical protein
MSYNAVRGVLRDLSWRPSQYWKSENIHEIRVCFICSVYNDSFGGLDHITSSHFKMASERWNGNNVDGSSIGKKVKLPLFTLLRHTEGTEAWHHLFLISALCRGEWSFLHPGRFILPLALGKESRFQLKKVWLCPRAAWTFRRKDQITCRRRE